MESPQKQHLAEFHENINRMKAICARGPLSHLVQQESTLRQDFGKYIQKVSEPKFEPRSEASQESALNHHLEQDKIAFESRRLSKESDDDFRKKTIELEAPKEQ